MTVPADPAFHVGLAFLLGMLGQVAARHLRLPGIVLLLALGVAAGPDGLDVLRPATLGGGLASLVTFAVVIVLFEGGMALDLREVWSQGRVIRRLVTIGALVTATGAGLAVHLLLGWEGPPAVLFGTLVIVTGPTVIQPILRRIRVGRRVAAVLEGEAIFGDAIGATLAVVALEFSIAPGAESYAQGWLGLAERLGFGVLLGLAAGGSILLALRFEKAVPLEIRNVLALAVLVGCCQIADAMRSESGIVAAIVAGLVVRNVPGMRARGLREFKEELTVLLLGLLFVLLAADVRLAEIRSLGLPGLAVVALLALVVRPLDVAISTAGSDLSWRERGFVAWLGPRGIVAAAVASYFAEVFESAGIERGPELRALVFLVIAVTVVVQGATSGPIARLLGVGGGPRTGWAILGANGLGLALAERLGEPAETVLVDSSGDRCHEARRRGFRAVEANGLEESTLQLPEVESRKRFVAATPNEEVNFIFARHAQELLKVRDFWIALRRHHQGIRPEMVEELRGRTLFGRECRLDLWALRLERGLAAIETRVAERETGPMPEIEATDGAAPYLPLVLHRNGSTEPYSGGAPRAGDRVEVAIYVERAGDARAALDAAGWRRADAGEPPAIT